MEPSANIPQEKQCRVLQVPTLDIEVLHLLRSAKTLAGERGYHPISAAEPGINDLTKATYLFATVDAASEFGRTLSGLGVPYSVFPASEYRRLSTEEMNPVIGAIFSAFAPDTDE